MAWEDDDVALINDYEGDTFEERYANAKKDMPDLLDIALAKRFDANPKIKAMNDDKALIEDYAGINVQQRYNQAKEDAPNIMPFNVLYPEVNNNAIKPELLPSFDKPKPGSQTGQRVLLESEKPKGVYNFNKSNTVENMDNAATAENPNIELTATEKLKQFDRIKRMQSAPTMTREQLQAAGISDDVIDALEREEVITAPSLESPFLDPLGGKFENLVGEKILPYLTPSLQAVWHEVKTFGIPRQIATAVKNGDTEAMTRYLKTIDELKSMKLGDEIFTGGKSLSNNIFLQRKYYEETLGKVKEKIRGRIGKEFPNSPQLMDDMKTSFDGLEKVAYQKTQDKYQAVEDVSSDLTYPIKDMKEQVLAELKEKGVPTEVYSEVKRNLEYIGRNMSPKQDAASKLLTGVETKLSNLSAKRTGAKSELKKAQASYDKLKIEQGGKLKQLEKQEQEALAEQKALNTQLLTSPTKPAAGAIKANEDLIASITTQKDAAVKLMENTSGLKAAKELVNKHNRQYKTLKSKQQGYKDQLPETDYVTEKEFMRMIKRFNEKTRTGGNLSTADRQVTSSLQLAKRRTQEAFENATKEHNPEVYKKFMDAQTTYKEYAEVFGSKTDIGSVTDIDDATQVFETIMQSPHKVQKFAQLLKQNDPELAKDFATKYITRQLGAIKEGERDLWDEKGIDLSSISSKLDNIINNPEGKQFVIDNIGQDKFDEMETMFNVTSGMKKVMDKIGHTGKLDDGFWQYFLDAEGGMNSMGRGLRYVVDGIRKFGADFGKSETTLAELVKKNDGKLFKSIMQRATPAVKKALTTPYSADWFTGARSQVGKMEQATKLINSKLDGTYESWQKPFEERMGHILDQTAEETGAKDDRTIAIAEGLVEMGLSPVIAMKTMGLAKGTVGYKLLTEKMNKIKLENERKYKEEPTDKLGTLRPAYDWVTNLFK